MSLDQHVALAERKARLIERIDAQRGVLAGYGAHLEKPLALLDKVAGAGHYVQTQPWLAGVGVFAAVVVLRRNLFRWVRRGFTAWRTWRFAMRWLREQGYMKS